MKSIKTTLSFFFAASFVAICLIIQIVSLVMTKDAFTQTMHQQLLNNADLSTQVVDEYIRNKFDALQSLSVSSFLQNDTLSFAQKKQFVEETLETNHLFEKAFFIQKGHSIRLSNGARLTEKEGFLRMALKEKKPIVAVPSYDEKNDALYFPFAIALFSKNADFKGFIVALADAIPLSQKLGKIQIGKTGYIYAISNETGVEVASAYVEYVKEGYSVDEEAKIDSDYSDLLNLEKNARSGKRGIGVYSLHNKNRVTAYAQCKSVNWSVLTYVPEKEINEKATYIVRTTLIISFLLILLASFIAYLYSSSIAKTIKIVQECLHDISNGNLSFPSVSKEKRKKILSRSDELGKMAKELEDMSLSLTQTASNVKANTAQISSATAGLATENQDLSMRTEQQASALEETSAAIEEMNASITTTGDNIKTAASLSIEAVKRAGEGASAIKSVITSMNAISDSSRKIANINNVINNIAFQTNLLALNASIEAARAGEAGKGFAVVAVEVRKLAKNSEKAAKEIEDLIKQSTLKVDGGVEIAHKAGKVLDGIINTINNVSNVTAEIDAASKEQVASVSQINDTLSSLDENTQKNAAMVQESATSTEELSDQALQLDNIMQFFKFDDIIEPEHIRILENSKGGKYE